MNNFAAIIFDMDGLLVDSEIIWTHAESRMLAKRGKGYNDQIPRDQFLGLRIDEFLEKLCLAFDLDDDPRQLFDEVVQDMLAIIPEQVVAKPGAVELLEYIQQHQLPCAIASSSPRAIIEAIVAAQGWTDVMRVRVSADTVARGKPAPDVYLATARELGVEPTACLALEDSPNGARAAVAAGMTCYAVPDTSNPSPPSFAGITPYVFDSLHTVLAQLTGGRPG